MPSNPFCHILIVKIESVGPTHTQVLLILYCGQKYWKVRIVGDHFRGYLLHPPKGLKMLRPFALLMSYQLRDAKTRNQVSKMVI